MAQAEEAHTSPQCQLPLSRGAQGCQLLVALPWPPVGRTGAAAGQQQEAAPGRGELPQLPALCAHSPAGATSARCAPRSPARAQCPAQSPPCAFVASPGDAQCQGTAVTVLSHSLAPGLPPRGAGTGSSLRWTLGPRGCSVRLHVRIHLEGERELVPLQCLNKQSFCAKQRLMYFIVQCHVYSGLLEEKNVINCPETHGSTIIWLL